MLDNKNIPLLGTGILPSPPFDFGQDDKQDMGVRLRRLWLVLLAIFFTAPLLMTSCKETGPNINLGGNIDTTLLDTTYLAASLDTAQTKAVLLEEFTGVACKNCPRGLVTAKSLVTANPGRVIIVEVHSGFLDSAYTGDPTLHNQTTNDLEAMLGPLFLKPSAAIDRTVFNGSTELLVRPDNAWPAAVNAQLLLTTPVNVKVEAKYNDTTNSILATVTLTYTASVMNDNRITVMVLEDSIPAAQLLENDSVAYDYIQERVLRTTLTDDKGDPITAMKEPKRVIIKEYKLSPVPADWNVNNLNIVAFVHEYASSFKVLQAAETKVGK